MKCPCGKHAACVPGCALMDYPGYTVEWAEPDPMPIASATARQAAKCMERVETEKFTPLDTPFWRHISGVEDDGFRTAYPEMPYSPPLPDVTRGPKTKCCDPSHACVDCPLRDPAPVASLVDEIDDWYAANDPLMAGAGDGNSPPWTEKTLLDDILEQRGARYGRFRDNAFVAQRIKQAMRYGVNYSALSEDHLEALDQISAKISRIVTRDPDYVDNWDDIAGYAKLVAERLREEQK